MSELTTQLEAGRVSSDESEALLKRAQNAEKAAVSAKKQVLDLNTTLEQQNARLSKFSEVLIYALNESLTSDAHIA